jgi:hypothetical protein
LVIGGSNTAALKGIGAMISAAKHAATMRQPPSLKTAIEVSNPNVLAKDLPGRLVNRNPAASQGGMNKAMRRNSVTRHHGRPH